MKTKRQRGFTLIEVTIGSVAGVIVILAAGTALVFGHMFLNKAWEKANLQRDASYAMLRISGPIKAGRSAELESDGKAIKIYREADWIRFFLEEGSSDLKCEIEGGEPQIVLDGKVEDVTFTLQGNLLGIDLKLKKDDFETHLVSTVMMRNYGG